MIVAFFAGYLPWQKRKNVIVMEAQEQEQTLTRVEVIQVGRSTPKSELQLPGNIQAITEAPLLARADGYLLHRLVDIGDRVKAGQLLAEIEAPELDEQVHQARDEAAAAQSGLALSQKALQENRDALREASEGTSMAKSNLDNLKNEYSTLVQQNMFLQAQNDQISRELSAVKSKLAGRG